MDGPILETKMLARWLIEAINKNEPRLVDRATKQFGVSRQTINRELKRLMVGGLIEGSGNTRARKYTLPVIRQNWVTYEIADNVEEDVVWRHEIVALLGELSNNVREICQFGFTEMLNNAIDHSESREVTVGFIQTVASIELYVRDDGVGIFNKIQRQYELEDPRHAVFELSKGKLTTNPDTHTGEGIFFTSRMFDSFHIHSSGLALICENDQDWLIEVDERVGPIPGTWIRMQISPFSERTTKYVFDRFAMTEDGDFGFSKTHVPLTLARYGAEQLLSRSQARRVLARCDKFREVILIFTNIESIGQAFADEIFRVYHNQHPEIVIVALFANAEVWRMIQHVQSMLPEQNKGHENSAAC